MQGCILRTAHSNDVCFIQPCYFAGGIVTYCALNMHRNSNCKRRILLLAQWQPQQPSNFPRPLALVRRRAGPYRALLLCHCPTPSARMSRSTHKVGEGKMFTSVCCRGYLPGSQANFGMQLWRPQHASFSRPPAWWSPSPDSLPGRRAIQTWREPQLCRVGTSR